jgi:hypothetical protein
MSKPVITIFHSDGRPPEVRELTDDEFAVLFSGLTNTENTDEAPTADS